MSQSEPLPINQLTPEEITLSPEIAAILKRTNLWANDIVEFKSRETNLIFYFSWKLLGTIEWASGKPVNWKKLSETVIFLQKLRKIEADEESFRKAA